jgi:hypothetical protein
MTKYRMTRFQQLQFALGFAWLFSVMPSMISALVFGYEIPLTDQYLMAGIAMGVSLWWIPRDRHLPLPPTEYQRGYNEGVKAGRKA